MSVMFIYYYVHVRVRACVCITNCFAALLCCLQILPFLTLLLLRAYQQLIFPSRALWFLAIIICHPPSLPLFIFLCLSSLISFLVLSFLLYLILSYRVSSPRPYLVFSSYHSLPHLCSAPHFIFISADFEAISSRTNRDYRRYNIIGEPSCTW